MQSQRLLCLLAAVCAAGTVAFASGCATTASTPRIKSLAYELPKDSPKSLNSFEAQMGQAGTRAVASAYRFESDVAAVRRLLRIGKRLTVYCERPNVPYNYEILDTKYANAMSLPDGSIYLTRGIVELMPEEGHIAAILAHEIAHVTHQHVVEAYQRQFSPGRILTGTLAATTTSLIGAPALGYWLVQQVAERGYSHQQEYQADATALRYLIRSGYGPHVYFEAMERMRAHPELEAPGGKGFFDSHPLWEERLKLIQEVMPRIESEENVRYNPKDFVR